METIIIVVLAVIAGIAVWQVIKASKKSTTTSSSGDSSSVATPLPKGTFQKPRPEDSGTQDTQ